MHSLQARRARRQALEWVSLYAYEHPRGDAWTGALHEIERRLSRTRDQRPGRAAAREATRLSEAAAFIQCGLDHRAADRETRPAGTS